MLTYAESFAPDQTPIFYALEGLEDALSSEAAACDGDRKDMGEAFDEYLAYQLEFVREVYRAGFARGTAFSIRVPYGEHGQVVLSQVLTITNEQFERARERGWTERVSISES